MSTVANPIAPLSSGKDEDLKEKGFFNRPRLGGKSIWDWLDLISKLAIPIVVLGATIAFNTQQAYLAQQQHNTDQMLAFQQHTADKLSTLDQQQATILQAYLDNIQDLLLHDNLHESTQQDANDVRKVARIRTLTALQRLDPERKGVIILFLFQADLIGINNPKITINKADNPIISLSQANLRSIDLSGLYLYGADMHNTYLNRANLDGTDLSYDYLNISFLNSANLHKANLHNSDFSGADLSGANLNEADLSGAHNLTQRQLDQVQSCKGAMLPHGLSCHQNQ